MALAAPTEQDVQDVRRVMRTGCGRVSLEFFYRSGKITKDEALHLATVERVLRHVTPEEFGEDSVTPEGSTGA